MKSLMTVLAFATALFIPSEAAEKAQVRLNDHLFEVEVVRTPEGWQRGLMYRERLAPHEGMLFWGKETRRQSFWMKNTLVSLDIIFIDEELKVVDIAEKTTPLSETPIPSRVPARHVLEIKAGEVRKRQIKVGDRLVLPKNFEK